MGAGNDYLLMLLQKILGTDRKIAVEKGKRRNINTVGGEIKSGLHFHFVLLLLIGYGSMLIQFCDFTNKMALIGAGMQKLKDKK